MMECMHGLKERKEAINSYEMCPLCMQKKLDELEARKKTMRLEKSVTWSCNGKPVWRVVGFYHWGPYCFSRFDAIRQWLKFHLELNRSFRLLSLRRNYRKKNEI